MIVWCDSIYRFRVKVYCSYFDLVFILYGDFFSQFLREIERYTNECDLCDSNTVLKDNHA